MRSALIGLLIAVTGSFCPAIAADTVDFGSSGAAEQSAGTIAEKARAAVVLKTPDSLAAGSISINAHPKTLSNGLLLQGQWNATWANGAVSLSVTEITNMASARTTGTLRLELWATSVAPGRGQGFSGYRLSVFPTLSPLPPNTHYTNFTQSTSFNYPPDGTYWLVLALTEFNSVSCAASDHYCISDSSVSDGQATFGVPTPSSRTVISQVGKQCYENYSSAAFALLQQTAPGLFQAYLPTVSCASLGMTFYAGYLTGSAGLVLVYTPDNSTAQMLCLSGAVSGCSTSALPPNYSDLWFNLNESGWGVTIAHHASGTAFIVWYTYDSAGNPKWYFASSCVFNGNACSGSLYETHGPPFGPTFNSSQVSVNLAGYIEFQFSNSNAGTMSYNVRGLTGTKAIQRLGF